MYVNFNTRQRTLAGSCSLLKDFFKLMNNSVFGKTQENLRKGVNVKLITDALSCIRMLPNQIFAEGSHLQIV